MSQYYNYFVARNTQLIGLSIDSTASHLAWILSIFKNTGIEVKFPVIADRNGSIAKSYGMFSPTANSTTTVRAVFYIDPDQIVRAILYYPIPTGRSIPEMLRLLTALQAVDEYKFSAPANWLPGQPLVLPSPKTMDELKERIYNSQSYNCMDWYLCYKETK